MSVAAQANDDFYAVTEVVGAHASTAQLQRICSRYFFAADFCENKDVLEVACGGGQGLGYIARRARRVVGIDIDPRILDEGPRRTYRGRKGIELAVGNAEQIAFTDRSFDVVILFEAIYYLKRPEQFVAEAKRVLRPGGVLLICSANKDLPDFNPSPHAHRYFGPVDFVRLLEPAGFDVELFGDTPVGGPSLRRTLLRLLKATAVRLHLMPKTMRGKAFLKRLFIGRLIRMPAEVDERMSPRIRFTPIRKDRPTLGFLVIHCVARLSGDRAESTPQQA